MRRTRLTLSALILAGAVAAVNQTRTAITMPTGRVSTALNASKAPTVGTPAAPSGEDMPIGSRPGGRQVFTDDFSTPHLEFSRRRPSKWSEYPSPRKDTTGYGTNSPLNVDSIAGGVLT